MLLVMIVKTIIIYNNHRVPGAYPARVLTFGSHWKLKQAATMFIRSAASL
jgi:hypothetical protein